MQACRYQADCQQKTCNAACSLGNGTSFCQSKARIFNNLRAYKLTSSQKIFLDNVIKSCYPNKEYPDIIQPVTLEIQNLSESILVADMLVGELCNLHWHGSVSRTKVYMLDFGKMYTADNVFTITAEASKYLMNTEYLVIRYSSISWTQPTYRLFCDVLSTRISVNKPVYLVGDPISVNRLPESAKNNCMVYATNILALQHQGTIFDDAHIQKCLLKKGGNS